MFHRQVSKQQALVRFRRQEIQALQQQMARGAAGWEHNGRAGRRLGDGMVSWKITIVHGKITIVHGKIHYFSWENHNFSWENHHVSWENSLFLWWFSMIPLLLLGGLEHSDYFSINILGMSSSQVRGVGIPPTRQQRQHSLRLIIEKQWFGRFWLASDLWFNCKTNWFTCYRHSTVIKFAVNHWKRKAIYSLLDGCGCARITYYPIRGIEAISKNIQNTSNFNRSVF